jgi:alpha-N-arabinofuranosidase
MECLVQEPADGWWRQIVNVIAPILTRGDELLIQSIFYPFEMFSRRREGVSLRTLVAGPTYEARTHGQVKFIDASAILDGDRLHVFVTNRSPNESATVRVKLADRDIVALESAELLTGPDAKAANSFDQPDVVQARPFTEVQFAQGVASAEVVPLSVAALTFKL